MLKHVDLFLWRAKIDGCRESVLANNGVTHWLLSKNIAWWSVPPLAAIIPWRRRVLWILRLWWLTWSTYIVNRE
jgi:hypothetical protein